MTDAQTVFGITLLSHGWLESSQESLGGLMPNDLTLRVLEELSDMGKSGSASTRELLNDLLTEIERLKIERDRWKDICDRVMAYSLGSDWQDIQLLYRYAVEDYNA